MSEGYTVCPLCGQSLVYGAHEGREHLICRKLVNAAVAEAVDRMRPPEMAYSSYARVIVMLDQKAKEKTAQEALGARDEPFEDAKRGKAATDKTVDLELERVSAVLAGLPMSEGAGIIAKRARQAMIRLQHVDRVAEEQAVKLRELTKAHEDAIQKVTAFEKGAAAHLEVAWSAREEAMVRVEELELVVQRTQEALDAVITQNPLRSELDTRIAQHNACLDKILQLEERERALEKKLRAAPANAMRTCADLVQETFPGSAAVAAQLREKAHDLEFPQVG